MLYKSSQHFFLLLIADIPPRALQIIFITWLSISFTSANFSIYGEIIAYTTTTSLFLTFGLTTLFPLDYYNANKGLFDLSLMNKKYFAYILLLGLVCVLFLLLFSYTSFLKFPIVVTNFLLVAALGLSRAITAIILTINRLISSGHSLLLVSYISRIPSLLLCMAGLLISSIYHSFPFSVSAILTLEIISVLLFLPPSLFLLFPNVFATLANASFRLSYLSLSKLVYFLKYFAKDCFIGVSFIIPQLFFTGLLNLDRSLYSSFVSSSQLVAFVSCSSAFALLSLPAGWLSSALDKRVLNTTFPSRALVNSHIRVCFLFSFFVLAGSLSYALIVPPFVCKYVGGFWCTAYRSNFFWTYLVIAVLSLSGDFFSNLSFYLSPSRRRMFFYYGFALLIALFSAPLLLLLIKTTFWPQISVFIGLSICLAFWIYSLVRIRANYK